MNKGIYQMGSRGYWLSASLFLEGLEALEPSPCFKFIVILKKFIFLMEKLQLLMNNGVAAI
ncbi:hypothetical protein QNH36_22330 [Mesobacillus sp. AQ2]|uniref:hypothetical protein n=1 Tax=Mesobacillus sp. AQ2 TaxID=3043332 RepID=UPI0024C18F58|nr:hypothetical protein [Mesobacillus sp. AQ2]WHX40344.1 hypothetical protein QNH36_22330 [Mesobacillus sp. AQ2]